LEKLFSSPLLKDKSLRRILSLIVFVSGWQIFCILNLDLFVNFRYLPSPVEVVNALADFVSGNPWIHIKASVYRVLVGYLFGALFGAMLGLLIGWFSVFEDFVFTPLEILRPIPAVAWIPLAILMFPSAQIGMIFITFIGAFFPVLISTIRGVAKLDQTFIRVAESLGAKEAQIFKHVVVPGTLPSIASGLVIGVGNSWFCVVTAEILSGRHGIGYITWESYVTSNYPPIVMGMLLIGLMGSLSTLIVDRTTKLLMPWCSDEK